MLFQAPAAQVIKATALTVALSLFTVPIAAAQCVDTSSSVPAARLQALARGFNLAGQLDGNVHSLLHEDLLRTLRSRGMRHVRLPVPAETVMSAFSSRDAAER